LLHAGGGKFDTSNENAYKVSSGLHGVGVSVVNAVQIAGTDHLARRQEHWMRFEHGDSVGP
jgi:DNA gyrase subunit B